MTGYTDHEHELICKLVDDLPRQLYGADDNDGWESTVEALSKLIRQAQERKQAKPDPRETHATDDRQAKPL